MTPHETSSGVRISRLGNGNVLIGGPPLRPAAMLPLGTIELTDVQWRELLSSGAAIASGEEP